MWTLWWLLQAAVVGPNCDLGVRKINTNICFHSFWQFILTGLVPFRYFTSCVHSFCVGVVLDRGTTIGLSTILWVYHTCCHAQLWCTCNCFHSLLLVSKQRDLCLLWKVLCNQSSWTYSHVMLWVHKNGVYSPVFIVRVLCWVLFLFWLVQHVVALPKIIRGPCLVSRDDVYIHVNLT